MSMNELLMLSVPLCVARGENNGMILLRDGGFPSIVSFWSGMVGKGLGRFLSVITIQREIIETRGASS